MLHKRISILAVIVILFACSTLAKIPVGDWNIFPRYGNVPTKLIDTGNTVYFLVSGTLHSYSDGEVFSYTQRNKLSDSNISDIQYNHIEGYLLVIYDNSNIDIIYDNGKVVNIPDIKNSTVTNKKINSASFASDLIYVATDFGYLIINRNKHEVKESHFLSEPAYGAARIGNYEIISTANGTYWKKSDKRAESLDKFTHHSSIFAKSKFHVLNDSNFLAFLGGWWHCSFNDNNSGINYQRYDNTRDAQLTIMNDKFMIAPINAAGVNTASFYNFDGQLQSTVGFPGKSEGKWLISNSDGSNNFWLLSKQGLEEVRVSDDGSITQLSEPFAPNACTVDKTLILRFNKATGKLMVTNQAETKFILGYDGDGIINIYDDGKWQDITPEIVPTREPAEGKLELVYSPTFDPDDPEVFYVGTWYNGVYKFGTNGRLLAHHSFHNTPLAGYDDGWIYNVPCIQFDRKGNLWILEGHSSQPPLMMLPKEKKELSETTAADWYTFNIDGFVTDHSDRFCIVKSTNVKLLSNGIYSGPLFAFDDNNTPDNTSDDRVATFTSFTDQDGNTFNWDYITCMVEDKTGKVWVGTDCGIIELNTANIFSPSFRINHLKVPRNDGTNYADYLLDNTKVYAIAVDESNRKWVATESSGVFLISADGSQVLSHLTASNSYLPSDMVYDVACDTRSNSVYFATPIGVVEYSSDSSAPTDDYSEIYAYPNPVRPEYTGLITITGLMENSLIKIADAAGNVVASGISNGGMFTWDGNNPAGEPVKTGVYMIFASQKGEDSGSKGAVTKILIVR